MGAAVQQNNLTARPASLPCFGLFLIIGLDAWCIKFLLQVQVLLIRSIGETKMGLNLAELPRPICGFGSIGGGVYGSQQ